MVWQVVRGEGVYQPLYDGQVHAKLRNLRIQRFHISNKLGSHE